MRPSEPLTLADRLRVRASSGWGVVINPDEARQIARLFDSAARVEEARASCVATLIQAGELAALSRLRAAEVHLAVRKMLLLMGLQMGLVAHALWVLS